MKAPLALVRLRRVDPCDRRPSRRPRKNDFRGPKADFLARSRQRRILECGRVRREEGMKVYVALRERFRVHGAQQPQIFLGRLPRTVGIGVIKQKRMCVEENLLTRRAGSKTKVDVVKIIEKAIVESAEIVKELAVHQHAAGGHRRDVSSGEKLAVPAVVADVLTCP
jgi:hypothetical protein